MCLTYLFIICIDANPFHEFSPISFRFSTALNSFENFTCFGRCTSDHVTTLTDFCVVQNKFGYITDLYLHVCVTHIHKTRIEQMRLI